MKERLSEEKEKREPSASAENGADAQKSPPSASRKLIRSIVYALIASIVISALMGFLVDYQKLIDAFRQTSLLTVVIPFAIIAAVFLIDSLRYKMVFRKFDIRVKFRDALYNNIIGNFFCNITPGSAGGQPFQVIHFSRLGLDSALSSNVVFSRLLEGNLIQLAIVLLFFHRGIGMIASIGKGSYLLIAGMAFTIIMTFTLLLAFTNPHLLGVLAMKIEKSPLGRLISKLTKNPRWAERLTAWSQGLSDGFRLLWRHNTWTMIADLLLYAVDQILWSVGLYFPLVVFSGLRVPFPEFLMSFILCSLISFTVPTPGASGSVEASFLLVLSALTGKPAATMSAILVWRFGSYYLHLIFGALIYFFVPARKSVYAKGPDGLTRHIAR